MLIGESSARWNGFDMENDRGYHEVKCLQDIVRRDKNHPSIIRWSANEAQCTDPAYHLELYDAIRAIDQTRPISEDIVWGDPSQFDVKKVFKHVWNKPRFYLDRSLLDLQRPGASNFPDDPAQRRRHSHEPAALRPWRGRLGALVHAGRAVVVCHDDRAGPPPGRIGCAAVRAPFELGLVDPRGQDNRFADRGNRHPVYGEDNLPDPWSHPGIRLLQTACHPLLAADAEFWKVNRKCDAFGHFPVIAPVLPAKSKATRTITVFNDELAGKDLELAWEVRKVILRTGRGTTVRSRWSSSRGSARP